MKDKYSSFSDSLDSTQRHNAAWHTAMALKAIANELAESNKLQKIAIKLTYLIHQPSLQAFDWTLKDADAMLKEIVINE